VLEIAIGKRQEGTEIRSGDYTAKGNEAAMSAGVWYGGGVVGVGCSVEVRAVT